MNAVVALGPAAAVFTLLLAMPVLAGSAVHAEDVTPPASSTAVFRPADRAVSTWRAEAGDHLDLSPRQAEALKGPTPSVARCVKLNNYWCIKKAGWNGEIAADGEGHVAFASATAGAAVAALLLKRYYVDFHRRTAVAIISHWAPAACGGTGGGASLSGLTINGIDGTLRARWLAGHARGFVTTTAGHGSARGGATPRRSVVAARLPAMMPAPTIAAGLNIADRPITLDALLAASPNAPASRSMIGVRRGAIVKASGVAASDGGCGGGHVAAYAAEAASGIAAGVDGDLGLFTADGRPTGNLALMMTNMARVEIGPLEAKRALIDEGIAEAFRPGRNPAAAMR